MWCRPKHNWLFWSISCPRAGDDKSSSGVMTPKPLQYLLTMVASWASNSISQWTHTHFPPRGLYFHDQPVLLSFTECSVLERFQLRIEKISFPTWQQHFLLKLAWDSGSAGKKTVSMALPNASSFSVGWFKSVHLPITMLPSPPVLNGGKDFR